MKEKKLKTSVDILTIWLIEGTGNNIRDWYVCWHEFFDTRFEALDKIDKLGWRKQGLLNEDRTKTRFRVRRYKLIAL